MPTVNETATTPQRAAPKKKRAKKQTPFAYAYGLLRDAINARGMFPPLHLTWTGHTFKPDPKRTPGFPTLADYRNALHAENLVIDRMRESAFTATQQKFRRKKIGSVATYLSFKGNLSYSRRLAGALIEHSPVFRQVLRLADDDVVVEAVSGMTGVTPTIVRYRKVLPALTIASREGKRVMALVLHAIEASQSVVIAAKAEPKNVMQIVKRFYLDAGWTDHAWRSVNNACSGSDRLVVGMPPALVNALAQAGAVSKLPQLGKVGIARMTIAYRHSHAPAKLFQAFAKALVGPHTREYYSRQADQFTDCLDMYDGGLLPRKMVPPQDNDVPKGVGLAWWVRTHNEWATAPLLDAAEITWTPALQEVPAHPMLSFVELTDGKALADEGAAMHHCVAGYASVCARGMSRIVSIRDAASNARVATAELLVQRDGTLSVEQVKGVCNKPVTREVSRFAQQVARANSAAGHLPQ